MQGVRGITNSRVPSIRSGRPLSGKVEETPNCTRNLLVDVHRRFRVFTFNVAEDRVSIVKRIVRPDKTHRSPAAALKPSRSGRASTGHSGRGCPIPASKCLLEKTSNRNQLGNHSFGSIASRKPSPRKLTASTVQRISRPGGIASHGATLSQGDALFSKFPHVGTGG